MGRQRKNKVVYGIVPVTLNPPPNAKDGKYDLQGKDCLPTVNLLSHCWLDQASVKKDLFYVWKSKLETIDAQIRQNQGSLRKDPSKLQHHHDLDLLQQFFDVANNGKTTPWRDEYPDYLFDKVLENPDDYKEQTVFQMVRFARNVMDHPGTYIRKLTRENQEKLKKLNSWLTDN